MNTPATVEEKLQEAIEAIKSGIEAEILRNNTTIENWAACFRTRLTITSINFQYLRELGQIDQNILNEIHAKLNQITIDITQQFDSSGISHALTPSRDQQKNLIQRLAALDCIIAPHIID